MKIVKKFQGIYYESHHILPKSLGGSNKTENLVLLTAREHFICHWLLCKMTTGNAVYKMKRAFGYLANTHESRTGLRLNSKQYEIASQAHSEVMKNLPQATKDRISKSLSETFKRKYASGEIIHPLLGKPRSEETKAKLRKPKPEGYAEKKSQQVKEYWKNNPHPALGKIGYRTGQKHKPESIELMSIACLARTKKTCLYCERSFDPGNYARYHGDKCKSKTP